MDYDPGNSNVVAEARNICKCKWQALRTDELRARTRLNACVETVDRLIVEKVASGEVSIREDYDPCLWRDSSGELYIVDGHVRTAIYYQRNEPMPVRIMDERLLAKIKGKATDSPMKTTEQE